MGLVYVFIFLFGMVATGVAIWIYKICVRWKDGRDSKKRFIIKSEKDGWVKTDHLFAHWSNRKAMGKWRKNIEDDLEMSIWIEENIKDYFRVEYIYGIRYIKFDNDTDGMAFKLRWC